MSRVSLYKGDDFSVDAETTEGQVFLHCDVYKNSKTTLKRIRLFFEELTGEMLDRGHLAMFTVTPNRRFVEAIGKPFDIIDKVTYENVEYEVVAWALK